MTDHTPIRTACRLLRQAAKEYAGTINGAPQWSAEPETAAAWREHIAAARALEDALVHDLEGVQRDDTEHGITYYTAADLAIVKERAYIHGRQEGERAARASQPAQEPLGYFRAQPFGWEDCSKDEEGAIALYERPAPQQGPTEEAHQNAQLANIYRWIIRNGGRAWAILDNWHEDVNTDGADLHEALARAALGRRADIPNINGRQAAAEGPAA